MSWVWMTSWRGLMPRSWARVEPATPHPSPSVPTRRSVGHEDVVQLDLVELGLAGGLDERVHHHARGVHVDDQCGDALLALGAVGSLRVRQRPQSANWA